MKLGEVKLFVLKNRGKHENWKKEGQRNAITPLEEKPHVPYESN
jgi:hypothetical protein